MKASHGLFAKKRRWDRGCKHGVQNYRRQHGILFSFDTTCHLCTNLVPISLTKSQKYNQYVEYKALTKTFFVLLGTRWIAHKIRALVVILDKYGIYIQHVENLAEDKSYSSEDRSKFKGWVRKWTEARVPLLIALFIEILTPAKLLSKCFQDDSIDVVGSINLIQRIKGQLQRIEQKRFDELPTVKRTTDKIKEEDGKYIFHGIVLRGYVKAHETTERAKNELVRLVKVSIEKRLEMNKEDHSAISAKILNTEGWVCAKDDIDVFDEELDTLYQFYKVPLENAGFHGTFMELLDEWHSILEYTNTYLVPTKVDYRAVWYRLFNSSRSQDWKCVLLLVELLFCLPISNAKVERFFSFMNRVKTDVRSSLGENRINSLLRIALEGPSMKEFDANKAIEKWSLGTENPRRPNQKPCKGYKPRAKKTGATTLMDIEDDEDET